MVSEVKYLHQVQDGDTIQNDTPIEGTPYSLNLERSSDGFTRVLMPKVYRDGKPARAETEEFQERFVGCSRSAATARQVSEWLQGVWAKRVNLALTIGEVP